MKYDPDCFCVLCRCKDGRADVTDLTPAEDIEFADLVIPLTLDGREMKELPEDEQRNVEIMSVKRATAQIELGQLGDVRLSPESVEWLRENNDSEFSLRSDLSKIKDEATRKSVLYFIDLGIRSRLDKRKSDDEVSS